MNSTDPIVAVSTPENNDFETTLGDEEILFFNQSAEKLLKDQDSAFLELSINRPMF